MRVVIDTNVLISAIGKQSPYRKLFDSILNGKIELCVSNDIFHEYNEILGMKTNTEIANNFANLISMLPNINFNNIFYKWNIIDQDPDDNNFIDCYIVSNSNYLITNDKHFDIAKKSEFPKINIISSDEFINNVLI